MDLQKISWRRRIVSQFQRNTNSYVKKLILKWQAKRFEEKEMIEEINSL